MVTDRNDWTDQDEHYASRRDDKFNWWPLLVLPLMFFIGWTTNEAFDNSRNEANNPRMEYGVGGAPGTYCITPGMDQ